MSTRWAVYVKGQTSWTLISRTFRDREMAESYMRAIRAKQWVLEVRQVSA